MLGFESLRANQEQILVIFTNLEQLKLPKPDVFDHEMYGLYEFCQLSAGGSVASGILISTCAYLWILRNV